jgi:hypothetical protein
MKPIHRIPFYFFKIHFNIFHPPTSLSSQWSSFRLSHQYPIRISPLPIRATCSAHLTILDLIILIIRKRNNMVIYTWSLLLSGTKRWADGRILWNIYIRI